MTDRKALRESGYTVTVEMTGAPYPNYAPEIGPGWAFVLRLHGRKVNEWADHKLAWAWAHRLALQTA